MSEAKILRFPPYRMVQPVAEQTPAGVRTVIYDGAITINRVSVRGINWSEPSDKQLRAYEDALDSPEAFDTIFGAIASADMDILSLASKPIVEFDPDSVTD